MAAVARETVAAVRVDSKGRVLLPRRTRVQFDLKPGDLVLVAPDHETGSIGVAKVINPFEVLAVEALALDATGATVGDAEIAQRFDLDLDAEPLEIVDPA